MTDVATAPELAAPAVEKPGIAGRSPWALAWRRLRRNKVAMGAGVLFLLIVATSFGAPLYASHISHTDPYASNVTGTTTISGKKTELLQQGSSGLGEIPIGPTWKSNYFLGADNQGRDVMARLLYGGRASLLIGIGSALIACFGALIVGVSAGFFGGKTDSLLSRLMDIIWAFPVYLLAICISTALLTAPDGLKMGPVHLTAGSLWLPTVIIGVIYIPYVARPIRGQVLSVREKEFVEAAIAQGASNWRLMFSDILPNVITVVIVLLPLMIATTILTEAALSFLSIGVQPPKASWGTIIGDGEGLLYVRPWVSISPGLMIVLTVLSLNVLGDGIRDALDPKAKLSV